MARVHIILADDVRRDDELRRATLDALTRGVNLTNVNLDRFERHGILTADLAEEQIPAAAQVPGVKSVEPDQRQRALA
jgi:hypothetical protein